MGGSLTALSLSKPPLRLGGAIGFILLALAGLRPSLLQQAEPWVSGFWGSGELECNRCSESTPHEA